MTRVSGLTLTELRSALRQNLGDLGEHDRVAVKRGAA